MSPHKKSAIATQRPLDGLALCIRTYDPFERFPDQPSTERGRIFTLGETYSCRAGCDGWVKVEDNSGVLHDMPNAAFSSYFKFV